MNTNNSLSNKSSSKQPESNIWEFTPTVPLTIPKPVQSAYATIHNLCEVLELAHDEPDVLRLIVAVNLSLLHEIVNKEQKETLFLWAVSNGFCNIVEVLVKHVLSVDNVNLNQENGLMIALFNNDIEMIKILLKTKININHVDKEGNTTLLLAIKHNNSDIAELLIRANAKAHIHNKKGLTCFDYINNITYFNDGNKIQTIKKRKNLITLFYTCLHHHIEAQAKINNTAAPVENKK